MKLQTIKGGHSLKTGSIITEIKTIKDVLFQKGDYSLFAMAVREGGLESVVGGEGPLTVFAPDNDAFAKLDTTDRKRLFSNKRWLARVASYHMVAGYLSIGKVMEMRRLDTLEGGKLGIYACDGISVNKANVIEADIECRNGLIHGIDSVLFP